MRNRVAKQRKGWTHPSLPTLLPPLPPLPPPLGRFLSSVSLRTVFFFLLCSCLFCFICPIPTSGLCRRGRERGSVEKFLTCNSSPPSSLLFHQLELGDYVYGATVSIILRSISLATRNQRSLTHIVLPLSLPPSLSLSPFLPFLSIIRLLRPATRDGSHSHSSREQEDDEEKAAFFLLFLPS